MAQLNSNDLRRIAKGQDVAISRASSALQRQLQQVIKTYYNDVRRLLQNRSKNVAINADFLADRIIVGQQLRQVLMDAGFGDLINDYVSKFPAIEKKAFEYFKQIGFDLGSRKFKAGINIESLDSFVTFSESRLRDLTDSRLVQPLQNVIVQSTFGTSDATTAIDSIFNFIDAQGIETRSGQEFSDAQIDSLINESLNQYNRHVTNDTASNLDLNWGVFRGPDDNKTSDVCELLLTIDWHDYPGLLSREEWEDTGSINDYLSDNNIRESQLLDVPVTVQGGHFNCRHRIFWMTERGASDLGGEV